MSGTEWRVSGCTVVSPGSQAWQVAMAGCSCRYQAIAWIGDRCRLCRPTMARCCGQGLEHEERSVALSAGDLAVSIGAVGVEPLRVARR